MGRSVVIGRVSYPAVRVERDIEGTVHVVLQHEGHEPFDFIQMHYDHRYIDNAGQRVVLDAIVTALGIPAQHDSREDG